MNSPLDDPLIGRLVIIRIDGMLRPGIVLKHEGGRCLVSVQIGPLLSGCTARNFDVDEADVHAAIPMPISAPYLPLKRIDGLGEWASE